MKIKLTKEQCEEIQNELTKLENKIINNRDNFRGWDLVYYDTKIGILQEILKKEEIDLDEIY